MESVSEILNQEPLPEGVYEAEKILFRDVRKWRVPMDSDRLGFPVWTAPQPLTRKAGTGGFQCCMKSWAVELYGLPKPIPTGATPLPWLTVDKWHGCQLRYGKASTRPTTLEEAVTWLRMVSALHT